MLNTRPPLAWILVFIAITLIVIAIVLTQPKIDQQAAPSTDQGQPVEILREQTFEHMLENGTSAILIADQTAGTDKVVVEQIVFAEPCFVAIYRDQDGIPGDLIGVSELLAEGREGIDVALQEPIASQAIYYAMLLKDDGDGQFSPKKDKPVQNNLGAIVLMTFSGK